MEYADQTSGAIRFYLTEGEFDLNQLNIIKRQTFSWKDFVVDFGILAASHFIQFKYRDSILNEVCACSDAIVPDNAKLLEYDFLPNLHTMPLSVQFLIFHYTFNFTYMNWDEGHIRFGLLRNKKGDDSVMNLEHTFPAFDRKTDHPVTEMFVEHNDTVQIHTVHTYPNEDMMVFTESTLET